MNPSKQKFKIRTRTQVLFGLMFALLLGAVLIRFNFENEQVSCAFGRQAKFGEFLADLASIDINTLANKSLAHLMTAAQAQLGAFYLFDETTRRLVCLNAQGVDRSAAKYIGQENNLNGLP